MYVENNYPLTEDQMRQIALQVATAAGLDPGYKGLTLAFLHRPETVGDVRVMVWTDVFDALQGQPPDMIICPWCKRDVGGPVGTNPHKIGCNRPRNIYSHAECGQTDYDDGW